MSRCILCHEYAALLPSAICADCFAWLGVLPASCVVLRDPHRTGFVAEDGTITSSDPAVSQGCGKKTPTPP